MNINDFIVNDKLQIPEDEIDNIYIWTRVSKTQEVLLSAENYFKLAKNSFDTDTSRITNVLKAKIPAITPQTYRFTDFMTFTANKHILFNSNTCFVYSANTAVLDSLACYIAHTRNLFLPKEESLADLITTKVDDPERISKFLDADFALLNVFSHLPEHKYRSIILDSLLTKRSKTGLCTLIYLFNEGFLIGDGLIQKELASRYKLTNINGLTKRFLQRRDFTYKQLMPEWIALMSAEQRHLLVYSKVPPFDTKRTANRYE